MKAWTRGAGGFGGRFGRPSRRERHEADLFLADLLGHPVIGGSSEADVGEDNPPAATTLASCARDVAVTDTLALLVTNNAPLPVTAEERRRAARVPGAVDDYKSVAAIVPTTPERRLLVFFGGNKNYVTVAPTGNVPRSVDRSGRSRIPRWTNDPPGVGGATPAQLAAARTARGAAPGIKAVPIKFAFEALAASQNALLPATSFANLAVKDPVVLMPEVNELNTGSHWSVPPGGQYGTPTSGTPTGPGTTRLQELVMECYDHLRCLQNPARRRYLPPEMVHRASWVSNIQRVFVSGHSGGGLPLVEAAGADMVLITPASVAGVGGRAVEFWLLDCTYPFPTHNYVNFCANWNTAGLLAYRADAARFVCVYLPKSEMGDTETGADALRGQIAARLRVSAASLRVLHDSSDMASTSMVRDVIPALTSRPVVFIRTGVRHDQIPTQFAPLLLRTAAS